MTVLGMLRKAWAQALAAVLGLWLMASPALLGYAGVAGDVHRIVGPVAASFAFVAVWEHMRGLRWATLALGAPLVVVPWILGFSFAATVNSIVVGLLLSGLAFVRGDVVETYGGGWTALVTGRARTDPRRDESG